ncbi:MAG TPA: NAD(P)-dependent oxidoreductase, partial [Xanthobacteraceae bacterium]
MRSFPLFLKLEGRSVLLVGGGGAAAAKLRLLGAAGARVAVITETPSPDLLAAIGDADASLMEGALTLAHVATADLV